MSVKAPCRMQLWSKRKEPTFCHLKGRVAYLNLLMGEMSFNDAVWCYETVLRFDKRWKEIEGRIGINASVARILLG